MLLMWGLVMEGVAHVWGATSNCRHTQRHAHKNKYTSHAAVPMHNTHLPRPGGLRQCLGQRHSVARVAEPPFLAQEPGWAIVDADGDGETSLPLFPFTREPPAPLPQ